MATMSFGVPDSVDPEPDERGPAFPASYPSECSNCYETIEKGELARADGEGGWEHADHKDEEDG